MALERTSVKKTYYYVICAVMLLILLWGAIDVASSVISYVVFRPPAVELESPTSTKGGMPQEVKGSVEPFIDEYYQSRMIFDRLGDSLARLIVAGLVFGYFSYKLKEMEKTEL
ncbi:hypothetical protein ACFLZ2_05530 [Candidatus Margulisiibacteriota bacterium]